MLSKSTTEDASPPVEAISHVAGDTEKGTLPSAQSHDEDTFTATAQAGVKAVEAATTVWKKWHLVAAYAM